MNMVFVGVALEGDLKILLLLLISPTLLTPASMWGGNGVDKTPAFGMRDLDSIPTVRLNP